VSAVESRCFVNLVFMLHGAHPFLDSAVPRNAFVTRCVSLGQTGIAVIGFVSGCTKVFDAVICRITVDVIQHRHRFIAVHSPDDAMHKVFFQINPDDKITSAIDATCLRPSLGHTASHYFPVDGTISVLKKLMKLFCGR